MPTHLRAVTAPRRAPIEPLQPARPHGTLLASLGVVAREENIIVLGTEGAELMCALLRAGAKRVTHLCAHERPEAASASLVIVPHIPSLDWLANALGQVRRALITDGRLVLRADTPPATDAAIRRMLALHGFAVLRASRATDALLVTAEVPAFGLGRRA